MPVIQSPGVDSAPPRSDDDMGYMASVLARGLVKLGYDKGPAEEMVSQSIRALMIQGVEITEQEILQQALCPNGSRR